MNTNDCPSPHREPPSASFPQRKAFVLRFSDDAGPRTGLFEGRIEHVSSGEQALFHSCQELWGFVRDMLVATGDHPPLAPSSGEAPAVLPAARGLATGPRLLAALPESRRA